jgi:hypothetical protein
MAQLTNEMLEEMKATGIISFATASKDGTPNVVPVGMIFMGRDGNIWLIDNYLNKTLANLKENPKAAFYIWTRDYAESFQIKGSVTIENSGPDYLEAVQIAHSKKETYPAKNLIKMKVEEIYYVTPGDHAGKKL